MECFTYSFAFSRFSFLIFQHLLSHTSLWVRGNSNECFLVFLPSLFHPLFARRTRAVIWVEMKKHTPPPHADFDYGLKAGPFARVRLHGNNLHQGNSASDSHGVVVLPPQLCRRQLCPSRLPRMDQMTHLAEVAAKQNRFFFSLFLHRFEQNTRRR